MMPETRAPASTAVSTHSSAPRVLLVDDDVLIGYAAMADLEDEGFDVEFRTSGREGLEAALHEAFDLIITDLMMPAMNGLQMIAALRNAGAPMPIVLATAVSLSSLPPPETAGYDRLLPKPYRVRGSSARTRTPRHSAHSVVPAAPGQCGRALIGAQSARISSTAFLMKA